MTAQTAPFGHKTLFRYRSFENPRPGWVSSLDAVGGIDHAAGAGDVLAYDRGTGFDRLLYTSFDGSSEYLRATTAINTVDTAGHDSFTIQAWFRAGDVSGWRTLISNTESNRGFSLKINNGTLRGLVRLDNGGSPVDVELRGGTIIAGRWYQAAFRVDDEDTYYDLHLFLDGDLVASRTSSHYGGVRQSSERPMVAAEPSGGAPSGDMFVGSIYAVAIQNYAVGIANFLDNDTIRDGSRYFGMQSYHDYLDGTEGPDHRISNTIQSYPDTGSLAVRRYAPFLNDSYVPQGVASSGTDRLYLTMFYEDTDGNNPNGRLPILVEMNTAGELRRVFRLQGLVNSDHVGGAAMAGGWFYTADREDIVRFDMRSVSTGGLFDPATFANNRFDTRTATVAGRTTNALGGLSVSFLSTAPDIDGKQILWAGHFDDVANSEMRGFVLNGDGSVGTLRHLFELPVTKVQGAFCYQASAGNLRFYLSSSYGENASHLRDVLYERGVTTALSTSTLLTLPAGLEGLAMIGNRLWMVSESGARYFQKRASPWYELFPFVFAYDRNPPAPLPSPVHVYRTPCGQAGIGLATLPRIGGQYSVQAVSPYRSLGLLYLGFGDRRYQSMTLPLSIPSYSGCYLNISPDVQALVQPVGVGSTTASLTLPNVTGLLGTQLFHQWFFLDTTLRASQALRVFIDR
ncbi:MAG: hypothetical protein KDC98_23510 [Planctomycetes bacterium]|nr:hypothetical protein [Planctomycetota bacterium]